jgi:uncharacterized MnhB-related membrane protein
MAWQRTARAVGKGLAAFALAAFVGYLVVYLVYAVALFRWPFDYDQGEGFELYDAILYSRGEWPYQDNSAYPFYASNYPPLFHLLIVPLLPVFGPRLVAGRLVSFLATLVTAGTIGLVLRRRVGGWFIPSVSGLAFLGSNYVYQIGPLCRLHMTMVMFEALAIAFIAEFQDPRHGKRNLVLGVFFLLCAGYTKQLAVFTVGAALSFVFLRDVKKAIVAGLVLALLAAGLFVLLNAATDGQWWVNIIEANVNEFDYRQALAIFRQWLQLHAVLVLVGGAYVAYELFWGRLSAYSLWFVLSLGMGALSGKWGAGFGYFATSVAAACLVSGLGLGSLKRAAEGREVSLAEGKPGRETGPANWSGRALAWLSAASPGILALLIPVLYLVQAPRTLHLPTAGPVFGPVARVLGVGDSKVQGACAAFDYHDSMGYTQLGHLLTAEDYAAGEAILEYVRSADGPAFSEEAAFSLLTDQPVVTNPTQLLNLYKNDQLDTTEMIERIYAQEFGVAVFRAQFYPPPVLEAVGQNYRVVDHVCMNGFYYIVMSPLRALQVDPVE